jgi:hypothetical protein
MDKRYLDGYAQNLFREKSDAGKMVVALKSEAKEAGPQAAGPQAAGPQAALPTQVPPNLNDFSGTMPFATSAGHDRAGNDADSSYQIGEDKIQLKTADSGPNIRDVMDF